MRKNLFLVALMAAGLSTVSAQYAPKSIGKVEGFNGEREFMYDIRTYNDTIFVKTTEDIKVHPVFTEGEWETYAFQGQPLTQYLKSGNKLFAYNQYREGREMICNFYLSEDYGKTFAQFKPETIDGEAIPEGFRFCIEKIVGQSSANPDRIYMQCSAYNPEYYVASGLYISDDFGKTWTRRELPFYTFNITNIAICQEDENIFALGGSGMFEDAYIVVTYDGGKTWNTSFISDQSMNVASIKFNPANNKEIYILTYDTYGHTTDGGETWDMEAWNGEVKDLMYVLPGGVIRDTDNYDYLYKLNQRVEQKSDKSITYHRELQASMDNGATWLTLYSEPNTGSNGYSFIRQMGRNLVVASTTDCEVWLFDINFDLRAMASIENVATDGAWSYADGAISYTDACNSLSLYDLAGKRIANSNNGQIGIANLSDGVYVAVAESADGKVVTFRFLK